MSWVCNDVMTGHGDWAWQLSMAIEHGDRVEGIEIGVKMGFNSCSTSWYGMFAIVQ